MKATKILADEIKDLKIASLPSRPNADTLYGGYGYTATQMKEAFDKLPLFIVARFNALLDDISAADGGIADAVKTGINDTHTLSELFSDVTNGALASYLSVLEKPLSEHIQIIYQRLEALEGAKEEKA